MNETSDGDLKREGSVDWALRYAAAGLSVVPIACDGSKQPPRGQAWKQLQERIANDGEIRRMFADNPGIAIICGKVSGNLETLDIDGPELVAPFEALVRELAPGLLEQISTVATPRAGSGGRHYRYRLPSLVAGNTKLAQSELRPQFDADGKPDLDLKTGEQRLAPETLIETRGEGGYAIAPGSPLGCHPSGLPYEHIAGPPLTEIPAITEEEHRALWTAARSLNRFVEDREVKDAPRQQYAADSPGSDYSARATWEEILEPAGWAKERCLDDQTYWRRPGKQRGVSATTGLQSSNGTELLCVFSSNAYPLEGPANGRNCSSYSKFAAYTALNHAGDYSAAARELKSRGYGSQVSVKPAPSATKLIVPQQFRPFPIDALPPFCRDFVGQAAESIDCDTSMIALPLLGALAGSSGNTYRIELKQGYSEPGIIWAAIVCESGTRKSPALECPLQPLRSREAELIKNYREDFKGYQDDIREFRAASRSRSRSDSPSLAVTEPKMPICPRLLVSDVTSEAVAARLEENPRGLLLVRDELAGFFMGMNQYKSGGRGGDEAAFLLMHGGRPLVIDRKNTDKPTLCVPMASLSIVGAIQPSILQRVLTRDRIDSGMAARFLFAYPPTRKVKWTERIVDPAAVERLETMFQRLLSVGLILDEQTGEPSPRLLPLSREAKRLWVGFHDEHSAEQVEMDEDLSAAWSKLTGYAARLALLYELAEWATGSEFDRPQDVCEVSMQAGIDMARWFSAETERIYQIQCETEEQRLVRETLQLVSLRGGEVSVRDLTRGPRHYRGNPELAQQDLQRLVELGLGTWVVQPSGQHGGRPTEVFRLISDTPGDETPTNKFGN